MKIPVNWLKDYINTQKSIKEISADFTALGLMLDKPLGNDVLDLEHRMDRSDWLSITGCARDLAAYQNVEFKTPELNKQKGKPGGGVAIKVECPNVVRRFNTRVFKNITVKESPEWLKKRLSDYGMTPINNIVDITNYVMVELGNPMHAQDLAKFSKREIVIRMAKPKETINTLDGSKIELNPQAFVLTESDNPIVIGGIVGGQKTGVDFSTQEIVLDAGNYDQTVVRKTARALKIQNETVLRYDKFLHPDLTELAIQRASKLILELAGGEMYENYDYYPDPVPTKEMKLRFTRVLKLGGMPISKETIENILTKLDYTILEKTEEYFKVSVPFFRTDIEVEDDIVADILRINGYHKIPSQMLESAPPAEITPDILRFEESVKDILVKLGMREHISNPFVKSDPNNNKQVKMENSLNAEENALRTSLQTTLYPIIEVYKKHGISPVGLFEIANIYEYIKDKYVETKVVQVAYQGNEDPYLNSLEIKKIYYGLLQNLGISLASSLKISKTITHNSFCVELEQLHKAPKENRRVSGTLENKIIEDLSLELDKGTNFEDTLEKLLNASKKIRNIIFMEEYFNPQNLKGSVLIRLEFYEKDTTKEEATKIKQSIMDLV